MSITKKFLKSKPVVKVTFKVSKSIVNGAKTVHVAGDFNDWNPETTPLKNLKSGDFSTTLELEQGREYQFRYVIDGAKWENDPEADKFVTTPYGDGQNCVLVV
ncbi:MAG: isoamylase early set domain-containing protein [Bacteroidota bacterium]